MRTNKHMYEIITNTLKEFKQRKEELQNENKEVSVLADLYNKLNIDDKNKLTNSLHDHFSQSFFENVYDSKDPPPFEHILRTKKF